MSAPWAPLQTGQTFETQELPPRAQRQVGVRGLVGTREDVDALAPTCWQEYSRHFVDISLHGFNILAFLCCLTMVLGQAAAMSTINLRSPELVVLGFTVICLWVLSIVGLFGTRTKNRFALRM